MTSGKWTDWAKTPKIGVLVSEPWFPLLWEKSALLSPSPAQVACGDGTEATGPLKAESGSTKGFVHSTNGPLHASPTSSRHFPSYLCMDSVFPLD